MLTEQSSQGFLKRLSGVDSSSKITVVDIGSDVRGWKEQNKSEALVSDNLSLLRTRLSSCVPEKSTSVLFIDSIINLSLFGNSNSSVTTLLAELKNSFSSVVAVAHTDVLRSNDLITSLESVATSVIEMVSVPYNPLVDVTGSFTFLQKRKNGKVARTTEYYFVPKASTELTFYAESQVIRKEAAAVPDNIKLKEKMDQLTPEQEAARAAVALPYARARQTASQSVSGLPELSLDVPVEGAVYIDPEDIDPDGDADLDDF